MTHTQPIHVPLATVPAQALQVLVDAQDPLTPAEIRERLTDRVSAVPIIRGLILLRDLGLADRAGERPAMGGADLWAPTDHGRAVVAEAHANGQESGR